MNLRKLSTHRRLALVYMEYARGDIETANDLTYAIDNLNRAIAQLMEAK